MKTRRMRSPPEPYNGASTRYDYRLNQHRILEFLYVKSKIVSKKKGNIGVESRKLLHDNLVVALGAVEAPGSKLYLNKLREVAKKHLDKDGPNYLPLDLNQAGTHKRWSHHAGDCYTGSITVFALQAAFEVFRV